MYAGPDIIRSQSQVNPTKYTIPTIIAIVSGGLFLILIVATIVLALIPIYLSKNTVPLNESAGKSQPISAYAEISQNTGRRKRADIDLVDAIGCTVGTEGLTSAATQLTSQLPTTLVSGISMANMTIGYRSDKKKRFALSKRQIRTICMFFTFQILYRSTCGYRCQLNSGSSFQQILYAIRETIILYNIPIFRNGIFVGYITRIQVIRFYYVSLILPGAGMNTDSATQPTILFTTTANATTTTSASLVTPLLG